MFHSSIVSLVSVLASAGLAAAIPVPVAKRATSIDVIIMACQILQNQVTPNVTTIQALLQAGTVTEGTLTPPIQQLLVAFNSCFSTIATVSGTYAANDPKASIVAKFVSQIITTLAAIFAKLKLYIPMVPRIAYWIAQFDLAFTKLIVSINVDIQSFTNLISALCTPAKVTLATTNFISTCQTLGY